MKPSYSLSFLHYDYSLINIENKALLFKQILIIDCPLCLHESHPKKCILWSSPCDKCRQEWACLRRQGMRRDVLLPRPIPRLKIISVHLNLFL